MRAISESVAPRVIFRKISSNPAVSELASRRRSSI